MYKCKICYHWNKFSTQACTGVVLWAQYVVSLALTFPQYRWVSPYNKPIRHANVIHLHNIGNLFKGLYIWGLPRSFQEKRNWRDVISNRGFKYWCPCEKRRWKRKIVHLVILLPYICQRPPLMRDAGEIGVGGWHWWKRVRWLRGVAQLHSAAAHTLKQHHIPSRKTKAVTGKRLPLQLFVTFVFPAHGHIHFISFV